MRLNKKRVRNALDAAEQRMIAQAAAIMQEVRATLTAEELIILMAVERGYETYPTELDERTTAELTRRGYFFLTNPLVQRYGRDEMIRRLVDVMPDTPRDALHHILQRAERHYTGDDVAYLALLRRLVAEEREREGTHMG